MGGEIGSTHILPPTQAPIPAPTPTITPPTSGGCYSNNYKDCLAGGSTYASCNNIWLPNGAQDNCVPYGETVPERLVVDLLNALAMVLCFMYSTYGCYTNSNFC